MTNNTLKKYLRSGPMPIRRTRLQDSEVGTHSGCTLDDQNLSPIERANAERLLCLVQDFGQFRLDSEGFQLLQSWGWTHDEVRHAADCLIMAGLVGIESVRYRRGIRLIPVYSAARATATPFGCANPEPTVAVLEGGRI